jgi:hypothetical protein
MTFRLFTKVIFLFRAGFSYVFIIVHNLYFSIILNTKVAEKKINRKISTFHFQLPTGETVFSSQSFFGKYFKRITGVSPKGWVSTMFDRKTREKKGNASLHCPHVHSPYSAGFTER